MAVKVTLPQSLRIRFDLDTAQKFQNVILNVRDLSRVR